MKHVTREQWLNALRSGKYKQGKKVLKNGDRFCCLGVFCDLAEIPHTGTSYLFENDYTDKIEYGITYHNNMLQRGALHYFRNNIFKDIKVLTCMNDNNRTFEQIADYVEEQTKKEGH